MSTEWLKRQPIPNYTLQNQIKISKILDSIIEIINKKRQQLVEFDSLIKSRFVEMFGQDLKGKSIRLGDLAEVITKGTTPTTLGYDFVDDGVNFIKVECITETGKFIKEKMLHINEECNEKLKRSKLKKDDILFSIAGAIGRTAIVTDDILPANTNQALSIIRLRKDVGLNVEFLNQVFKTDLVAEQIEKRINGVAQMNVSLADIGNLKIIRPTIERQNEFAKFVQQVDKLKFVVQKSLDETQKLFDSLMQEYFG
jgi:type I restriction enzyme S subunit